MSEFLDSVIPAQPVVLSIDRCPVHGFFAVSLNQGGTGTRLTRTKCCGRWKQVIGWPMQAAELRELADLCERMAEDSERQNS